MLTAIVPIGDIEGRLQNLESWLRLIPELDLRVILVNDFKDEQTLNELSRITEDFKPEKLVFHCGKFGSPGAARNYGLDIADSDYICFWDSDDLPKPITVCRVLSGQTTNFDILIGQYGIVHYLSHEEHDGLSNDYSLMDIAFAPGLWRMIFSRKFVSEQRFETMKMGEDQLFIAELVKNNPRMIFTEQHFYDYSIGSAGQLTSNTKSKLELVMTYNKLINIRKGTSGIQFQYLSAVIIRLSLSLLKLLKHRGERIKLLRTLTQKNILFNDYPLSHLRMYFWIAMKLIKKK